MARVPTIKTIPLMPTITSGNTNAPTQALARHASAMLVEDLKLTRSPPARNDATTSRDVSSVDPCSSITTF